MKRVLQVATGAVLCFALTNFSGPAHSQQPNAPELFRPAGAPAGSTTSRATTI
jgi:hypothetical protein